jgi:hypothetical protein
MSLLRCEAEVYHIGRLETQTFSWPGVEAMLDPHDLVCCDLGERHFFREVLPDQAIGVFVESAFPTVIGFGKVALAAEFCSDSLVASELLAIVKRDGLDDLIFEHA